MGLGERGRQLDRLRLVEQKAVPGDKADGLGGVIAEIDALALAVDQVIGIDLGLDMPDQAGGFFEPDGFGMIDRPVSEHQPHGAGRGVIDVAGAGKAPQGKIGGQCDRPAPAFYIARGHMILQQIKRPGQ